MSTDAGAVVYSLGGTASLFGLGPHSPVTSVLEIAGAAPYALGYVLLARGLSAWPARPVEPYATTGRTGP